MGRHAASNIAPSRRIGVTTAGVMEATGMTWRQVKYLERCGHIKPDIRKKNSRFGRYSMQSVEHIKDVILPGLRAAGLMPPPGIDPENAELPGPPAGTPIVTPPIPVILAEQRSASPSMFGRPLPGQSLAPTVQEQAVERARQQTQVVQTQAQHQVQMQQAQQQHAAQMQAQSPYGVPFWMLPPWMWPPWWAPPPPPLVPVAPMVPTYSPVPTAPVPYEGAPAWQAPAAMAGTPMPQAPAQGSRRWFPCVACKGVGVLSGAKCPVCGGMRVVLGRREPCTACMGRGWTTSRKGVGTCAVCGGTRLVIVP